MARFAAEAQAGQAGRDAERLLTERELDILRLAACGLSNADIANRLSVSMRTVQAHLTQVFNKLGASSRTEAVIAGLRRGMLRLEDLDGG